MSPAQWSGRSRPKGKKDASGHRPQLGTKLHLPPRREAVTYAWKEHLLTDEEYASLPPAPPAPLPGPDKAGTDNAAVAAASTGEDEPPDFDSDAFLQDEEGGPGR